jgi:WD40 repeat protein
LHSCTEELNSKNFSRVAGQIWLPGYFLNCCVPLFNFPFKLQDGNQQNIIVVRQELGYYPYQALEREDKSMKSLLRKIIPIFAFLFILPLLSFANEKPELFVQKGHTNQVTSAAFSPDGRYIISGSNDYTLKLWDVSNGREIRTFQGHNTFVNAVAFSPDGRYVISGSNDDTLKLWDVSSGREIRTFKGHTSTPRAVAFSPDGKYVLSGSMREMKLWDVSTGREIRTFQGSSGVGCSVAFSPDGKYLLSISDDKVLKLFNVEDGLEISTYEGHSRTVKSVAFSPDGKYVFSGGEDTDVKLWDVSSGKEIGTFAGSKYGTNSVAFSPDGRYVLAGSIGEMNLLEVATGRMVRRFKDTASSVAISPDGRYALSACNSDMKLWDLSSGTEVRTLKGNAPEVDSVTISPDGTYALSSGRRASNKSVDLWDVSKGRQIRTFAGVKSPLALSPDGRYVLSGGRYGDEMKLWEVSNGRELRTFQIKYIHCLTFSPDGRYILYGWSDDNTMKLWEVSSGREVRSFQGHTKWVTAMAFSPDGRHVLSGSSDKVLKLWDVSSGREVRTFDSNSIEKTWISAVAFSPDGRYAISAVDGDKTPKLWDVSSGKEIRIFQGHTQGVNALAFSPDGRYVLSGSWDGTMKLWDVSTGREIRVFHGDTSPIFSVVFSSDGRYALSGSRSGATVIWDVSSGHEIAQMVGFSDGEWVVITPEGYFNASPNGAKYLNVRVGNNVYSIDNFYERFFNPVYVASVLQGKKVETLADIRKGIMTPPDVQITSPKANETISSDAISVSVSAKDTGGGIDEISLFHNGKVVGDGTRAVKIVPKGQEATKTYTVTLTDGINTFRAVGFSKDRTESNPYELVVHLSAPQKDISLHVLAVGINKYRNPALNLNYAVPDAKGITDFFNEKGKGLFKKVDVTNIYDENATRINITAKLKGLENTNPQDVVLIYLAGHGENISDKWYFIPYELAYPEREDEVKSKGISSDDIAGLIRNIKAQKVLVMIDSCKAGAMLIAMRGFEDRKALSQLSRSTGVHVIAASTKDQFAAEVKELGHGVFTYTLLEGLKGQASTGNDKTVTVRKLMTHVENRLPDITMKYRNEAQFPVVDSRGMDFPLVIMK